MKTLMRRASRDEKGMTVAELLMAMTITALIMLPLTSAIFLGLRNDAQTQGRVDESNGMNKLAWYFAPDVQDATTVGQNVSDAPTCGAAGMTVKLLLTGPNGSISFYQGTGINAEKLYRRTCANGNATASLPLVQYLSAPPQFAVTNDNFGNWRLVSVTVTQKKQTDSAPYTATLQASRRVN